LEKSLGWEIETEAVATEMAQEFSTKPQRRFTRMASKLVDALTPDGLEAGPSPGSWRSGRWVIHRDGCMFADILVLVSGEKQDWPAVGQATGIACHESSRLLGLHVVPSEDEKNSTRVQELKHEFARRCQAAGVWGKLAVDAGRVARRTCERSRWADLIVLSLIHPPAPRPVAKLSSGLRTLIRRCPTPVLAVPGSPSALSHPLLAYDGSPKAQEALYIAAYLAGQRNTPLVVVTITEGGQVTPSTLDEAGEYLKARDVRATLISAHGPPGKTILDTATEHNCDLILMGGYGHGPVMEVVLGSAVDEVLRASRQPVLICR
jgi:nucleotide-binding universal stress UspA family protein